jgi:AcrR family transcriptional regulator
VQRSRAVDAEGIARAALALLDEGGLETLTMRSVAATLGVAPSSLYSRVRSLEDVLDLALDAALGADSSVQELVHAHTAGPEVLDELLLRHFRHLRRHPWELQVLPRRALRGPHHLALSERMCGLLEHEGARNPLTAAYALSNLVIGSAITSTLDEAELATPIDEQLAPVYARLHGAGAADSEDVLRLGLVALRQALTAP